MTKKEMTYKQAQTQLEEIIAKLERNELDIDQLTQQIKEAKKLIEYCKDKLNKTDTEVQKILNNINI